MGVPGGGKLIWTCDGLSTKDIHNIWKHLPSKRNISTNNTSKFCCIDVDISNILHKLCEGKPYQEMLDNLATFY